LDILCSVFDILLIRKAPQTYRLRGFYSAEKEGFEPPVPVKVRRFSSHFGKIIYFFLIYFLDTNFGELVGNNLNKKNLNPFNIFDSTFICLQSIFETIFNFLNKKNIMRLIIFLFSFLFVFTACQDGAKTADSTSKKETVKEVTPPHTANKYKLTPFTASTAYSDAKLESVSMKEGKIEFNVDGGSSYELGQQTPDAPQKNCANSAKGQHIHVLVDDKPYAARYTAAFDDLKIDAGQHYMLAFLSRSYHESIKTPDAFLAIKTSIHGNGNMLKSAKITEPMIWYSRPKGTYTGKAATDKVMLDFYLVNTDLQNGNTVKADINGETHIIHNWQPYYIEGLPMGKNKITLSLLDKDGNVVKTPQNPISREFTLAVDPTEKM